MSHARLFHLTDAAALEAARASGQLTPPSLEAEGFVHLSFAHQLAGTLAVHFPEAEELVLVEVDADRTADGLVVEASRGGEGFPHLYRPLALADLLRAWRLTRGPAGLAPPELAAEAGRADEDRPPGEALPAVRG